MSQPDLSLSAVPSLRPQPVWIAAGAVALLYALPMVASGYWLNAIILPFLILSLAGLGLNLLTGYAGQLSLGSGAFMAIGAYATFLLATHASWLPLPVALVVAGLIAGLAGAVAGLPSLRIKGFYLIVGTLALQFFVEWLFLKFPFFYNGNSSGTIALANLSAFGIDLSGDHGRYWLALTAILPLTLIARNLVRHGPGRSWMAIRDMDTAAAVIGIPVARAKITAFAVSSFYLGIAGALWAFAYLGTASVQSFGLTRSYQILFIIILGGMGSLSGAFLGAAFVSLLPIALDVAFQHLFAGQVDAGLLQNLQKVIFGALIIWFLIREPEGLARLLTDLAAGLGRRAGFRKPDQPAA
ncbi:MAG: branched-chain amino acid ABC transporter permease [Rhodovulum sulfidophilum]|uniref:Branched-chain amino acid ABC transporter permease n=1 Tax=Rhodovulum sulfidophilum TaxID=35806 RepID=A0A2W5N7U1_RHOSU|nr:MAG: branched-chain amino acid ABC transporter permease [Rhodovulum sulfidophilum]